MPITDRRDDLAITSFPAIVETQITWKTLDEAWSQAYELADRVIARQLAEEVDRGPDA
jgi:hypothetical protein